MPAAKRLNSVCHSIAHHAVSGLSYIHPHVMVACKRKGIDRMVVNLLEAEPCPCDFRDLQPLPLSLRGLRDKLIQILASEGFVIDDLSLAKLTFTKDPSYSDDSATICRAQIASKDGKSFVQVVDCLGQSRRPE